MIIGLAYLFLDLRIHMVVKRMLGMPKPCLTIVDEVPTKDYFEKILPLAKRNSVSIAVAVEPWHIRKWQKYSGETLKESLAKGTEVIPMHVTFDDKHKFLNDESAYTKQVAEERDFFVQEGLQTNAVVMPWRKSNRKFANTVVPKYYDASFLRGSYNVNRWPLKSKHNLNTWIVGYSKPMNFAELRRFVEEIKWWSGWGILVVRSWRQQMFTPQALNDLEYVIQYAKEQGVDVVTVREGLKRFGK